MGDCEHNMLSLLDGMLDVYLQRVFEQRPPIVVRVACI